MRAYWERLRPRLPIKRTRNGNWFNQRTGSAPWWEPLGDKPRYNTSGEVEEMDFPRKHSVLGFLAVKTGLPFMIPLRQMTFHLIRISGLEVRCHYFVPLLAIGLILRIGLQHPDQLGAGAGLVGLFCLALLFHVLVHALTWIFWGAEPVLAIIDPLGGSVEVQGEWGAAKKAWTALSAPLFHFKMALVSGVILYLFDPEMGIPWNPFRPPFDNHWHSHAILGFLSGWFWVNWVLGLVNFCLPGVPYDGGEILSCWLAPVTGWAAAEKTAARIGLFLGLFLAFASIVENSVVLLILAILGLQRSLGILISHAYQMAAFSEEPFEEKPISEPNQSWLDKWRREKERKRIEAMERQSQADEERQDRLLEKIHLHGKSSLTPEELRFLQERADRYRNRNA